MALHENGGKLILAVLMASVAAILSALTIDHPSHFGGAALLLVPGFIVGMIVANNIHDFSPWVVALANFGFYFGGSCVVWHIWRKYFCAKDRE